jgi:hypothetical protein
LEEAADLVDDENYSENDEDDLYMNSEKVPQNTPTPANGIPHLNRAMVLEGMTLAELKRKQQQE